MFSVVRNEVSARFLVARQFLNLVPPIELAKPVEAATCKGLLFVHMYGVYEYGMRFSVQVCLSAIRANSRSAKEVRRELLTLVLNPLWAAAAASGPRRLWETRLELMSGVESNNPLAPLDDTLFPADGSHYRPSQLYTIWKVFGIDRPIVSDQRHLGRIEELVENRNAIAHGRNTAEEIGRRYSMAEMEKRIDDVAALTNYVIDTMESHYSAGALWR